jgi:hypothetical protein
MPHEEIIRVPKFKERVLLQLDVGHGFSHGANPFQHVSADASRGLELRMHIVEASNLFA